MTQHLLPPLPAQPEGVPWPTTSWPVGDPTSEVDTAGLATARDRIIGSAARERCGRTLALLVVHQGTLVVERYAPTTDASATQRSWSVAKSILHALVGIAADEHRVDPALAAPVPGWKADDDPRRAIRLEDLLRMVDGLDFIEPYEPGQHSDVVEMLRDPKNTDTAAYAEAKAAAHRPGSRFNYSSGSSIIIAAILRRALGGSDATEAWMRERLFEPIGMTSAKPRFDQAGTFLGSSYLYATPRDLARFGLLYLRGGTWNGRRILPEGWVDQARTPTPAADATYGAHWWLNIAEDQTFCAKGMLGQYLVVCPRRDVVALRLGQSTDPQRENVEEDLGAVLRCFPALSAEAA